MRPTRLFNKHKLQAELKWRHKTWLCSWIAIHLHHLPGTKPNNKSGKFCQMPCGNGHGLEENLENLSHSLLPVTFDITPAKPRDITQSSISITTPEAAPRGRNGQKPAANAPKPEA
jgi:hypothetical protein